MTPIWLCRPPAQARVKKRSTICRRGRLRTTLDSIETRQKRSSSRQAESECCHRHVRVLSAWVVYESLASLWMTGWRPLTTWPCYCRRAPVCCTRWESCARTAFRRHRCTTYFAPLSFHGSSMRRQHSRKCVHQLNVAVLTRFCVAANA